MSVTTVHVVVLAAGRGSRLQALGAQTPKWLLDVGGATIADVQLEAVKRARADLGDAVGSVRVVTGHAADEVDRYLAGHDSGSATPIHNPEYATLNNWYTVLVALQANVVAEGERLIILNSDLFASAGWFAEFIVDSASTDSDSLIAVDVERTLTDESMKVAAVEGGGRQLLSVIGKVAVEDPVGEYVGMLMAGGPVLRDFRAVLESFVGRPESTNEWYERAVGVSAASGTPWRVWPTPDGHWVEIDDDGDYAAARAMSERL